MNDESDHGPECFCTECIPAERTVTVETIDGLVHEIPESEAPQF